MEVDDPPNTENAGKVSGISNARPSGFQIYNSSQAFSMPSVLNEDGKGSEQPIGNEFSSLAQSAGMYSEETDMLALLSSVANSEQERKAKKLEEMAKKQDTQSIRENLSASSPSSSSSSSSSNEEDEDSDAESSELDEEDCDRIRSQCLDEMSTIEKQFTDIRDQLYKERHSQITCKLKEVESETATEYLNPYKVLSQNKQTRIEVCEILKKLRKDSIKAWYQSQRQSNTQHFENEKNMMADAIRSELEEKIKILEEDRDNVDFSTELWSDATLGNGQKYRANSGGLGGTKSSWLKGQNKKMKREQPFHFGFGNNTAMKRKKKPVTVTGPYIVYMLRENDIVDDWTVIKRALTASKRRKSGFKERVQKTKHSCRIENKRLQYDGRWFQRGQSITMRSKETGNINATIISICGNEVCAKQGNGTVSKMHVQQLIRGKFIIRQR